MLDHIVSWKLSDVSEEPCLFCPEAGGSNIAVIVFFARASSGLHQDNILGTLFACEARRMFKYELTQCQLLITVG
jgi:hypothetical protein